VTSVILDAIIDRASGICRLYCCLRSCCQFLRSTVCLAVLCSYAHDTCARNWHTKACTSRQLVLVFGTSDVQFGTEFFRYRFSVTNRTVLYFLAGSWYRFSGMDFRHQFLVRVSWASLVIAVCHVHKWGCHLVCPASQNRKRQSTVNGLIKPLKLSISLSASPTRAKSRRSASWYLSLQAFHSWFDAAISTNAIIIWTHFLHF